MKEQIPLLEEHRQPGNGQGQFREAIEHVDDHGEDQSPNVNGAVVFIAMVHFGPQEDSGGREAYDDELNELEDVDEGISLDEKPFLVGAGLEKRQFGDRVPLVDEGRSVP